jgi:hypothetical protein
LYLLGHFQDHPPAFAATPQTFDRRPAQIKTDIRDVAFIAATAFGRRAAGDDGSTFSRSCRTTTGTGHNFALSDNLVQIRTATSLFVEQRRGTNQATREGSRDTQRALMLMLAKSIAGTSCQQGRYQLRGVGNQCPCRRPSTSEWAMGLRRTVVSRSMVNLTGLSPKLRHAHSAAHVGHCNGDAAAIWQ